MSPLRAERKYALLDEAEGKIASARRRLDRAAILGSLGRQAETIDLLDELAGSRYTDIWPALDPALASLRGEERFDAFLERVRPK